MKKSRFIVILFTIVALCAASFGCRTAITANGPSAEANQTSTLDAIKYGTLVVFHETPTSRHFPNHDRLVLYRDIPGPLRAKDYTNPRGMYTQSITFSPDECIVGQWRLVGDTLVLRPSMFLNPETKYFPKDSFCNIISRPMPEHYNYYIQKYLIKSDVLYNITDYTEFHKKCNPSYNYIYDPSLKRRRPIYKLKTFCSHGEIIW